MPDTPALQGAFGPATAPRPGCGVPVAPLWGLFPAGTGVLLKLVVAPRLPHDRAQGQVGPPTLHLGAGLLADRGLGAYAPWALLVQAGVPAVPWGGARPIGEFTPGRPLVTPRVRRTPAVKAIPRSCGRKALGGQDHLVAWLNPTTWPSWLTRESLLALPDSRRPREVRYGIGRPGFRRRQSPLVPTRLDAAVSHGDDLAEWDRRRWQGDTSRAHLKTTRPLELLHGQTVPGVRKDLTVSALVSTLGRLVMGQASPRPDSGVERLSVVAARRWLGAPSPGLP